MMSKKSLRVVAATLVVAMVAWGCETTGQSAGAGALVGAIAGGIIGDNSGRALEGAAIGALVGAAAGAIIHDVRARSRQTKTASETIQKYDYKESEGLRIESENASATPTQVTPGKKVLVTVQYAVLGAGSDGVRVTETHVLRAGSEKLELSKEQYVRADGTYTSELEIAIPEDLKKGNYSVQTTAATDSDAVTFTTNFSVV